MAPPRPARTALVALALAAGMSMTLPVRAGADAPAAGIALASDAGPVSLEDYRGRHVYVDFFASWCVPCRASFPFMDSLRDAYSAESLGILAIGLDADPADARAFVARLGADFDVAYDPSAASAESFGLTGMPGSYLLDPDGRVVWSHVGFRQKDVPAIEAAVAEALGPRDLADSMESR